MKLTAFYNMQRDLRDVIIKKHELEGKDMLPNFILSLHVELGELANEWGKFKYWKVDPQPNRIRMLEEYADCLSFALEIGLEINQTPEKVNVIKSGRKVEQFNEIYYICADIGYCHAKGYYAGIANQYEYLLSHFFGLGEALGFSQVEIEQAYYDKNKVNHERQASGY